MGRGDHPSVASLLKVNKYSHGAKPEKGRRCRRANPSAMLPVGGGKPKLTASEAPGKGSWRRC